MSGPRAPRLTTAEIARLEQLLGTDGPGDTWSASKLHGYFAGLHCLPDLVTPSEWFAEIDPPEFATHADAEETIGLLMRLYNQAGEELRRDALPLMLHRFDFGDGEPVECAQDWCIGFVRAVDPRARSVHDLLNGPLAEHWWLITTLATTDPARRAGLELPGDGLDDSKWHDELIESVMELHQRLAPRRRVAARAPQPAMRSAPKVGRNDPCPCGSGKKFKLCCGLRH